MSWSKTFSGPRLLLGLVLGPSEVRDCLECRFRSENEDFLTGIRKSALSCLFLLA